MISDATFCELAQREGLLDAEQVATLRERQDALLGKGQKVTLAQIAIDDGLLTEAQVADLESNGAAVPPPVGLSAPPPQPAPLAFAGVSKPITALSEDDSEEEELVDSQAKTDPETPKPTVEPAEPAADPAPVAEAPASEAPTRIVAAQDSTEERAPLPKRSSSKRPRRTSSGLAPVRRSGRGPKRGSGSGAISRRIGGTRRGTGASVPSVGADDDDEAPRRKKDSGVLVLAGLAGVAMLLFVGVTAVVLNEGDSDDVSVAGEDDGRDEEDTSGSSTSETVDPPPRTDGPPVEQPPERSRDEELLEKLADEAYGLASRGEFREAREVLERFPSAKRSGEAWEAIGVKDLARYRERAKVQVEFQAALAQAKQGDTKALLAHFKSTRDSGFAFAGEAFLDAYVERAEEALGEDVVETLILKVDAEEAREGAEDAENVDVDEPAPPPIPKPVAMEIQTRGSGERRARFAEEAKRAEANVAKAREALAEHRAQELKRYKAITRKIKKDTRGKIDLPGERKPGRLLAYDAEGFTLKVKGKERRYDWESCPPELGHTLRKLGTDTSDAAQLFDLGLYALSRGEFEHADRAFRKAVMRDRKLEERVPDVEALGHLLKLFRGKNNRLSAKFDKSRDATEILWAFKGRPQESLDFTALAKGITQTGVKGSQLIVRSRSGAPLNMAQVRGHWVRKARLSIVPATVEPRPAVLVHSEFSTYLITFGSSQVLVFGSFVPEGKPLAFGKAGLGSGQKAVVQAEVKGPTLTLTVTVAGRECIETELPFSGEIEFGIGSGTGGEARFDEVRCHGFLSEDWAARVQARGPHRLARIVRGLERRANLPPEDAVPVAYRKTSAEDDVALAGVPKVARGAIEDARDLMLKFRYRSAERLTRNVAERHPSYHAANYLYGLDQLLFDEVQAGLIRLRRAVRGVEDFYEAQVGVSDALFLLGRREESRKILEDALKLRADYPPARVALSNHLTTEARYDEALAELDLAAQFAPNDGAVRSARRRVRALSEGPAWARSMRSESEHYVLRTDMTKFADGFTRRLETMRSRYEEAFGVLVNAKAKRERASVLVFSEPEGFYSYSARISGSRSEDSVGYFSPRTGQLLMYMEDDPREADAYHVLYHEGMHQWAHAQGVSLPYWASEGMAEYVAGTRLSKDGDRILQRGIVDGFLRGRLDNLTANWSRREKSWLDLMNQSPREFYAGDSALKYSMAWSIVLFIMEGGDEKLKRAFMDYLEAYTKVSADEKASLRGGAALEYIYVETFHQLDMPAVERRWAKFVEKTAREAGINWTVPE